MTRWYVPAYVAPTGIVCPLADPTVSLEYARDDCRRLRIEDKVHGGENDIFVAFMDKPQWQRLEDE